MHLPLNSEDAAQAQDDLVIVTEPGTTNINKQARTGLIVVHSQDRNNLEKQSTIERVLAYAETQGLKNPGISSRQAPYPFINPTTEKMDGFRLDVAVMGR